LAAKAQELAPSADRILSDPTYLPLQGQIYGATGYQYGVQTGDTTNAAGQGFSRSWNDTYSQRLVYGLTNRLSFNLGLDYATIHARDTSPAGALSEGGRQGFADPSFGVTYRVIDQADHPFSLDVKGAYSPNLLPLKSAAGSGDGTVAAGGATGDIGLAIGRETKFLTVQASVVGHWIGPSDLDNMATGETIHTAGHWVPTVGLATQTRLTPRLSVNVNAAYNIEPAVNVVNQDTGVLYQSNRGDIGSLGMAVNYHFVPNRVVGSLTYNHSFYGQTDNVFPVLPDRDSFVDRDANTFGATVQYVFR
jgi:hypothetical protein